MSDPKFHKSSYSSSGANCVEVSEGQDTQVRDTQNRDAATLSFPAQEWRALVVGLIR